MCQQLMQGRFIHRGSCFDWGVNQWVKPSIPKIGDRGVVAKPTTGGVVAAVTLQSEQWGELQPF